MAAAAAAARTVSLWIFFFFFCSLVSFSFFLLIRCLCHQVHQRKHGFYRLRRCYCCCFVSFFTGYTNGEGGEDVTCKTIGDCTHRHDQSCSEDTRWRLKGIECNVKREDLPIFFCLMLPVLSLIMTILIWNPAHDVATFFIIYNTYIKLIFLCFLWVDCDRWLWKW